MTASEFRDYWRVPAKRGMRVTMDGKPGRITSMRAGHIYVVFDGEKWPQPCHPRWRVDYHTDSGVVKTDAYPK